MRYRIAVGPRAGHKLFTLQTVPPRLQGLEGHVTGAARAGSPWRPLHESTGSGSEIGEQVSLKFLSVGCTDPWEVAARRNSRRRCCGS